MVDLFLKKTWGKLENKWKKTSQSNVGLWEKHVSASPAETQQSNPGKVVFFWRLHLAFDGQILDLSEAKKKSK
jgi:hypothetical protein